MATDVDSFPDLIRRVRAGDEAAAAELVRQYEPAIRRAVHARLADLRLRRLTDSEDICQSVLASFFVRAALGQFQLDTPEQLLKLLVTIARNRLARQVRDQRAARRDHRRLETGSAAGSEAVADGASPSRCAEGREMLLEVCRRLTADERRLAELKGQGYDWSEIAEQVGGRPDALRKKLTRAVTRVTRQLGLDEAERE